MTARCRTLAALAVLRDRLTVERERVRRDAADRQRDHRGQRAQDDDPVGHCEAQQVRQDQGGGLGQRGDHALGAAQRLARLGRAQRRPVDALRRTDA